MKPPLASEEMAAGLARFAAGAHDASPHPPDDDPCRMNEVDVHFAKQSARNTPRP